MGEAYEFTVEALDAIATFMSVCAYFSLHMCVIMDTLLGGMPGTSEPTEIDRQILRQICVNKLSSSENESVSLLWK